MAYTADLKHRILREAYKNYLTFQQFVADEGKDVIEYAVETERGSGVYTPIAISYSDLALALEKVDLAPRKKEAFMLNVIYGYRQQEAGDKMGISAVSVGQYVESAVMQLSKYYFAELDAELDNEDNEAEDSGDTRKVREPQGNS